MTDGGRFGLDMPASRAAAVVATVCLDRKSVV